MLKKFFLNFLSSFVGAWVALGLFGITVIIVIVSLLAKVGMSESGPTEKIRKHSVMVIDLNGMIEERPTPAEPDYIKILKGDLEVPLTLTSLTSAIREASDNKDVDMIYLKCGVVGAGMATLRSLRQELLHFKESGKKIYAYGDAYSLADYYVASVADSLFVNPNGTVGLNGISGTVPYFKDLLDKVGIQVQIVKVGTFKSAVEPYIANEMSQPARAQLDTLYGNIWKEITSEIGKSRRLTPEQINSIIDKDYPQLQDGYFAVKKHLADKAVYERTMDSRVAAAVGVEEDKLNYISSSTMSTIADANINFGKKKRIAVLFATGEIMEGSKTGINCEVLVPIITELAEDNDVSGMVLRVNSPGGSVFGSEQIAEALEY
ncbi:MAG: S49 family peptidase, partial [Muribaculaceae bacterium]|nr:S49 family peptidase [Muribaculaceae bacterium]